MSKTVDNKCLLPQYSKCGTCDYEFDVMDIWHCPRCGWTIHSQTTYTEWDDMK